MQEGGRGPVAERVGSGGGEEGAGEVEVAGGGDGAPEGEEDGVVG